MKSVFDGWEKQIAHRLEDDSGGYCAIGWLGHVLGFETEQYSEAAVRIMGWTLANLGKSIAGANNEGDLDIEGFKMVDLLTRGYVPEEGTVAAEVCESAERRWGLR